MKTKIIKVESAKDMIERLSGKRVTIDFEGRQVRFSQTAYTTGKGPGMKKRLDWVLSRMQRPNLLKALLDWRKERKARKAELRRRAGYEWAHGEYFLSRRSQLELEACVETSRALGHYDEFDQGIEEALRVLQSLGLGDKYHE